MKVYTDTEILNYILNAENYGTPNGLYLFETCDVRSREDIMEEMNEYYKIWDTEYVDNPCVCKCSKYKIRDKKEYCCFCGKVRQ